MPIAPAYKEQELLHEVAAGNVSSFEQLYDHYRSYIYTAAFRLMRDGWVAEEIVQDVFLKVWLKRTSLITIDNFTGWIITITENLTLNAIKRAAAKKNNPQEWILDLSEAIDSEGEQRMEEKELYAMLDDALNTLTPRQKETFILIKQQGHKREEAAAILNVSAETVKSHLEQAMRTIRAYCMARMDKSTVMVLFLLILKK